MMMRTMKTFLSVLAVGALAAGGVVAAGAAEGDRTPRAELADAQVAYHVTGRDGRLIRQVTGPVTDDIDGVPARPVDAFNWDGGGIEPVRGQVSIDVDPVANTGRIRAQWTDRNGHWRLEQTMFAPPPHPTGLEIGSSGSATNLIEDDPVITNVYLHGDSGAAEPVLPTVFNLLATWGPAEVTLNGQPFENVYDGPTPRWVAHLMVTEGVRQPGGQVTANDGADIYNPIEFAGAGDTQRDDLEVHLTFHDAPGPTVEDNFPPLLSFFYHVQFEQVDLRVDH